MTQAATFPAADPVLEKMDDFFTARLSGYDHPMLVNVEGCAEGYVTAAQLLPAGMKTLLDLGCGTGLELDEIFRLHPCAAVTGIDMTPAMLAVLRQKHADKALTLIEGDYFTVSFGEECFDAAVSVESLHHFTPAAKLGLYKRLYAALRPGGVYVECDYMVETQAEEDFYCAELDRLKAAQGLAPETFYHYDTPLTVENQQHLLREAGFAVRFISRKGGTTVLLAEKN